MDPWLRAFFVTLGALALFVQPGPFLNDEVGQMAAVTSLARGEMLVQPDLPAGYDPLRAWGAIHAPAPGEPPRPMEGSTMTAILALPFLALLRVLEVPLGPMGAVGLLAAAAVAGAAWCLRPSRAAAAAAGGSLWLGAQLMQVGWRPPSSPYLEAASLQMLNIVFHAFATALVYDLLRTRVERPVAGAALFAFGTPALFWTLSLKYHGVTISLAAIVLWLYQDGHRTPPLRTALAFTVAGLAVWNHLPNGLLTLASLSLMALPAVLLGWRPLLARAGAGAVGLGLGVLPEAVDRAVHNALAVRDRFIQVGGGADVGEQIEHQERWGRLRWTAWNDPGGPFDAFWQLVVWPDPATPNIGAALPLLALIPLVAVVVWAYRRPARERIAAPLLAWPVVHLVLMLVLFGRGLFQNGWGFDLRHAATLYPLLAVPLAALLSQAGVGLQAVARTGLAVLGAMAAIVWLPLLAARQMRGHSALGAGPDFDLVDPLRYIGFGGAAVLLAIWWVPRLRRWRPQAAAAAMAWSLMVQALLQLGPARTRAEGASFPFVAWPMALLERAMEHLLLDVW